MEWNGMEWNGDVNEKTCTTRVPGFQATNSSWIENGSPPSLALKMGGKSRPIFLAAAAEGLLQS